MMRRVTIGVLTVLVLGGLFFVLCTYRVRTYETVVLDRMGSIVPNRKPIAYGWYWCLPTDRVVRMDRRQHIHPTSLTQVNTSGGRPISVQAFAVWQISDADEFYRRFPNSGSSGMEGDVRAASMLDSKVMGKVGAVLGKHKIEDLFGKTTESAGTQAATQEDHMAGAEAIEQEITREVNAEMKEQGIDVRQVGFARLVFPPGVASAVYERMAQERMATAATIRIQGDAEAVRLRGEGDAKAREIEARAKESASKQQGAGEAAAYAELASVQGTPEAREFFRFWREMELLKKSVQKGTYIILPAGKPLGDTFMPGMGEKGKP